MTPTPITLEQAEAALQNFELRCGCEADMRNIRDYTTQQAERLRVAIEALQFYADKNNYDRQLITEDCGCCSYWHDAKITDDVGSIAQTALKAQGA